jgi:hypothetical protein
MQEIVWGHSYTNRKNSHCKELMDLEVTIHSSVTYIMHAFGIINQQEHLPEIFSDLHLICSAYGKRPGQAGLHWH